MMINTQTSFNVDNYDLNQRLNIAGSTIEFFCKKVPSFVESEMENLYGNLFSSLKRIRLHDDLADTSTYILRRQGIIVSIFLFRQKNDAVHVMNEFIEIEGHDISLFSQFIFSTFKSVSLIFFSAIRLDAKNISYPFQYFNSTEDTILTLPPSVLEYMEQLGNSTRRNIKRYLNKIERECPSFTFEFFEKEDVTPHQIDQIIKFKISTLSKKGKKTNADQLDVNRILEMVKACDGLVGIAKIDGRICGGEIIYRVGNNYFSMIGSHDPDYNAYSLGTICCYLAICECIARNGKEFHFLWGREPYKQRLSGIQKDFQNATVYRSAVQMIINSHVVISNLYKKNSRKVKFWLLDPRNRHTFISRLAIITIRYMRGIMGLWLLFVLSIGLGAAAEGIEQFFICLEGESVQKDKEFT